MAICSLSNTTGGACDESTVLFTSALLLQATKKIKAKNARALKGFIMIFF
jgi:hypothetical protein